MKTFLGYLVVLGGLVALVSSATVQAAPIQPGPDPGGEVTEECSARFLTFPAWYRGLVERNAAGECEIKSPSKLDDKNKTGGFTKFIWTIVLNIVEIMLQMVGYLSVGYIIYGGYKYIYGAGSPDKMVSARKTILNAIIGLIISVASVAIVNTIAGGL